MGADENLSLHQESIESLAKWRPKKSRLEKVKDEDFIEIAWLMGKVFVENDWFTRMWVVQVSLSLPGDLEQPVELIIGVGSRRYR